MLHSGGSSKKWPKEEGTSDFYVVFCNVRKEELCEVSGCINVNVVFYRLCVKKTVHKEKKKPENLREAA